MLFLAEVETESDVGSLEKICTGHDHEGKEILKTCASVVTVHSANSWGSQKSNGELCRIHWIRATDYPNEPATAKNKHPLCRRARTRPRNERP